MEMLKRIEVTPANLNHIDFGSVIALTFAAEGAMGEAGGIEFSTADGSLYHLNYVRGPASLQQLHMAFPSSPTNLPVLPGYWHELYLGVGNCLFLHDQAYKKYRESNDSTDPEDAMIWWRSILGKSLLTKQERYAWLVDEVKNSYPQTATQADELIWCDRCQNEINLWTYWQGQDCLDPEILVVGQDWGNPETAVGQQCLRSIENQLPYLESTAFPSDKNLAVLFKKALDRDIGKKDERLFFTNMVLGYRTGKTTGSLSAAQYSHDLVYLKTLVNILRPKVVICLGQDTFTYALRAFGEKVSFLNGYISALDAHENHINVDGTEFFGMSHCGNYGCKNRGGNIEKGLALQISDWKEIAKWL